MESAKTIMLVSRGEIPLCSFPSFRSTVISMILNEVDILFSYADFLNKFFKIQGFEKMMSSIDQNMQLGNPDLVIRPAIAEDLSGILSLFEGNVRSLNPGEYTKTQISAWAAAAKDTQKWVSKLRTQYFLVAVTGPEIQGFASLERPGYLDMLYVHKDFQGRSTGSKLLASVEQEVRKLRCDTLRAHVSKVAFDFFQRRGFQLVSENRRMIDGEIITNYAMEKKY